MYSEIDINANYFTDLGIDFKQLLYFVVVVEHMNFSKAAAALYVTQPLLSQRIAALEKALGCQLLVRSRRGIQLTPAGEVLAQKAREIIALTNALTFSVRRAASTSQPEGELNIAIEDFFPDSVLTDAVFHAERNKRIVFNLYGQPERKILQGLENNTLDIGVLPKAARRVGADLSERIIGSDTLCFVIAERFVDNVSLQDFVWLANRFPTIVLEGNNYCTERILQVYKDLGVAPDFTFLPSLRDLFMRIECGGGITLLPSRHLPDLKGTHVISYPLNELPSADIQIAAYWKSDSPKTLITEFVEILADSFSHTEKLFNIDFDSFGSDLVKMDENQ